MQKQNDRINQLEARINVLEEVDNNENIESVKSKSLAAVSEPKQRSLIRKGIFVLHLVVFYMHIVFGIFKNQLFFLLKTKMFIQLYKYKQQFRKIHKLTSVSS